VAQGNLLASRTLVIILIAASLNVWWLLEQPQGSWMEMHPLFQEVLRLLDVRHRFTMGAYGSPSEKPTWIYSSDMARPDEVWFYRIGFHFGSSGI
jgi:hypothetical protein